MNKKNKLIFVLGSIIILIASVVIGCTTNMNNKYRINLEITKEKLEQAKSSFSDKLQKLAEFKSDPNVANLTVAINKLQQAITDNESITNNDSLSDINNKGNALDRATKTAEDEKTIASQKNDDALNKLAKKINKVKQTKDSMNNEPALNNAKTKLEQAIQVAEAAKDKTPKLTDVEIKATENNLVDAKNEAKTAIDQINQEKSTLKTNIQNKADKIKNYLQFPKNWIRIGFCFCNLILL
ncbi:hypothetical protein RRG48_06375 [Mycoplasmopsis canis]|uniref:hypothetical protein n=2 Tax=Mycoplasmopsis cynos TaxID=171284 RepID=UPI002AFFAC1A|nr:hypothetical protein [Mycoplasmopsis cynos]WQQ12989.1 hypothetical protein RRG58_03375 [Mycoplasmopsis cynos]WQQ14286.1 hypothetical protein RRG52_01975 [Mycoplasmopsis cynos]